MRYGASVISAAFAVLLPLAAAAGDKPQPVLPLLPTDAECELYVDAIGRRADLDRSRLIDEALAGRCRDAFEREVAHQLELLRNDL